MYRADGNKVRTKDAMYEIVPYIMPKRFDASNSIKVDIDLERIPLDDPNIFRKSDVSRLPALCDEFNQCLSNELLKEKQTSLGHINAYKASLLSKYEYLRLPDSKKAEVENRISQWIDSVRNATTKDAVGSAMYYGENDIRSFIKNGECEAGNTSSNETIKSPDTAVPKVKRSISITSMSSFQQLPTMSSKADVAAFLSKLKAELEASIDDGFVIGR